MTTNNKRLYRSNNDQMISGVCGGIAEYLNSDPTVIRLIYVLAMFVSGFFPLAIAYIIAVFIIPRK